MDAEKQSAEEPVTVDLARPEERGLIEGLFQFYAYDFSEFARDGLELGFDADGRIPVELHLERYWSEADRWPLIIRVGPRVAGFALINTASHRGGSVERNMAEFFVARRFRRRGVATQALHAILRTYPGAWEIAVAAANSGALKFWPAAIASAPNVSGVVRLEGDGVHWTGPIWSFVAHRA